MGLARSTYYDAPPVKTADVEIVANITAICDVDPAYCEHQMQDVLKGPDGKARAGADKAAAQFA